MTAIDLPEDFFTPPTERPATWPDNPPLRTAVEWLKGFLAPDDWRRRRNAAADKLHRSALGELVDRRSTGAFFDDGDTFGWFLFLADAFLDHIHNYEPMYGSRVVPVITAIGRDLELIRTVGGVDERVARMVGPERSQPNGGLFELLVAAAYRREGYSVAFVPEHPSTKTHDMDVTRDGHTLAVECKRMETGDYGEAERMRMRELWGPSAHWVARHERSTIATIHFRIPVEDVPDDYVTARVAEWWRSEESNRLWSDDIAYGSVGDLDLEPLQAVLETDIVLSACTRLQQLLSGVYERNANFVQLLRMKYADNPRYMEECDLAIVLRWETLSPVSIDNKARDVFRKLVEANKQLPADRPGIVHVGFEAVEGDTVERARYAKILETVRKFDPQGKPLEWVYAHYLVPESPPDEAWAYDETTQWASVTPTALRPLMHPFLVIPPDGQGREGAHWT